MSNTFAEVPLPKLVQWGSVLLALTLGGSNLGGSFGTFNSADGEVLRSHVSVDVLGSELNNASGPRHIRCHWLGAYCTDPCLRTYICIIPQQAQEDPDILHIPTADTIDPKGEAPLSTR